MSVLKLNCLLTKVECWDEVIEGIFDEVEDYALSTKFKKFVDLFVNEVIQNLKFKKDVVELICHTEVQNVLAKDCKELKCYFYTARFYFLHFYFFDVRCLLWSMLIKGLCWPKKKLIWIFFSIIWKL